MDGVEPPVRIIPFRGDYCELSTAAAGKVRNLVYPVPNPAFPFLGVHFTRMIDGAVECGPNAVFSFRREGYSKIDFSLRDSWESLSYPGTWVLFAKHWKYGLGEYTRAFSKKRLLADLQRLIPSLTLEDLHPGTAGVRAQALGPDRGPGGRLPDRGPRQLDSRAQRAVARRHGVAGHRGLHQPDRDGTVWTVDTDRRSKSEIRNPKQDECRSSRIETRPEAVAMFGSLCLDSRFVWDSKFGFRIWFTALPWT